MCHCTCFAECHSHVTWYSCVEIIFFSCHSINSDVHPVLSRCHDAGVPAARAVTAQLCTQSAHCKVTHPRIRREFAAALSPGRLARLAVGVCCSLLRPRLRRVQLHSGQGRVYTWPHWLSAQLAPTREGGLAWLACPHPRARIAIFKSGREWHQNNGRNNAK